jgi:eukaryotic-like serine/threonine-protein kinase
MPDAIPACVGAYPIRGVLGSGSRGVVYLGVDPAHDRPVAIKTIPRHLLHGGDHDAWASAGLRFEVLAASRFPHRHIAAVYEFGEDESCVYIVTEYVPGHSLAEYLRRPERLAPDEVACLMVQLLDALHCAHEWGLVHRGIKPANLMVDRGGQLKVTDFGIAGNESSQVTRPYPLPGSTGYMAPEQYTGGMQDHRVDIFAAGVLMYEMLAGSLPFSGTDAAIMYQVVYGQHESLVSRTADTRLAAFDAILDRALAKAPDDRMATALEFQAAIRTVADAAVPERLAPQRLLPLPSDDATALLSRPPMPEPATATIGPSAPALPPGSDGMRLGNLERVLALHVGPLAKVLVRRASTGTVELAAVRQRVAAALVDDKARERFLAGTAHLVSAAGAPAAFEGAAPAPDSVATRQTAPLDANLLRADDVDKAAIALARSLGPVARVLARRCAQGAVTREQFVGCMLAQLSARIDAAAVESELWRTLG